MMRMRMIAIAPPCGRCSKLLTLGAAGLFTQYISLPLVPLIEAALMTQPLIKRKGDKQQQVTEEQVLGGGQRMIDSTLRVLTRLEVPVQLARYLYLYFILNSFLSDFFLFFKRSYFILVRLGASIITQCAYVSMSSAVAFSISHDYNRLNSDYFQAINSFLL